MATVQVVKGYESPADQFANRGTTTGRLLVGDRGLGRLQARDAADAAARVRRRTRVVEPRHRRAAVGESGTGAHVEELFQGQLAVEDVAADQAVDVLPLVRADEV